MVEGTSEATKLSVFISYSRDDLQFADQLDAALGLHNYNSTIDRHGISGGEEWKRRLGNLIRDADTIIFVLSPSSARSDICAWEVEEAVRLGKRVIPVLCRPLEGPSPPPQLADLNYIFFYPEPKSPGSGFGTGLVRLVAALNTDLDWLREHTRYIQRATEWETGGRSPNRLLSGSDINLAKAWVARRPKGAPAPTTLQLNFIRSSEEEEKARASAQRRQLDERDRLLKEAEQAASERANALEEAEAALEKTSRLRRQRAWGASLGISILLVVGWWAYGAIKDQLAVAREAARDDIRGQIFAYGSIEDESAERTPYSAILDRQLSHPNKSILEALADTHQAVIEHSRLGAPLLSTSMNGRIYLKQQPPTREKRVVLVAVDNTGASGVPLLRAPRQDAIALNTRLPVMGFRADEISMLHNPNKAEIEQTIAEAMRYLDRTSRPVQSKLDQSSRVGTDPRIRAPANTLLMVFFFGFGIQVAGQNYVLPRTGDGQFSNEEAIKRDALSVVEVRDLLERSAAASVLVLAMYEAPLRAFTR